MNGNLSAKLIFGVFDVFVMSWKLWEFLHHPKSLEIGIDWNSAKKNVCKWFVHVVLYFVIELNIQIRHLSYDKAAVMHHMQKQIHSIFKKN